MSAHVGMTPGMTRWPSRSVLTTAARAHEKLCADEAIGRFGLQWRCTRAVYHLGDHEAGLPSIGMKIYSWPRVNS